MSQIRYATQPPDTTAPCGHCPCCQARATQLAHANPKRTCGCPNLIHEHGCYNRHRVNGCDGSECGGACPQARSRYESARRQKYRKFPPPPPDDPNIDWVVVERLMAGMRVKATHPEVIAAVKRLRARGVSFRGIRDHLADPAHVRMCQVYEKSLYDRKSERLARERRARLEVAA